MTPNGVTRITPVKDPTPEQAEAIAKAPVRLDGTVRNVFLTLAWHPMLLARFNAFAGTFFRFGRLSASERELIILRVASRARCAYELAQHVELARQAGLSDATMLAVLEQPGAPQLNSGERLLLQFTDAVFEKGRVEDSLWRQLGARYDEAQLLELISVVGFYRYAADLMNVIGIEPEDPIDLAVDWFTDGDDAGAMTLQRHDAGAVDAVSQNRRMT